jgi:homoserine O-acetyltransferase
LRVAILRIAVDNDSPVLPAASDGPIHGDRAMSFAATPALAEPVADACRYVPHVADAPSAIRAVRGNVRATLSMRHAGERSVDIAWEAVGPADAPVLVVAGGISANRHAIASHDFPEQGWWQNQSGAGLDPRRFRLVSIDWVGADGTLDVAIDSADQADAIAAVLDALGVAKAAAFIGSSYGAMVGLQFAARHPQRVRRLVAISGAHRAHPYASAWRALQRQAVALGQLQCDEGQGLALARQLAMLSYRTPNEFAERFDAAPQLVHGRARVAAQDYLEHCAATWVARTSPTAFLRLSESIDLHRVDPREVRVPTTVVAIVEDRLVPLDDLFALAEGLPRGEIRVLRSKYGHDAFLTEPREIADILGKSLEDVCGDVA